jgi:hypothetical protein
VNDITLAAFVELLLRQSAAGLFVVFIYALYPAPLDAQTLVVFYTNHTDLTGATSFVSRLDVDRWLTLDVACKVLMCLLTS